MENPCKKCITLAACKSRAKNKSTLFIMWASNNCPLYRNYVMNDENQIKISEANELGKIFGYEIVDNTYWNQFRNFCIQ